MVHLISTTTQVNWKIQLKQYQIVLWYCQKKNFSGTNTPAYFGEAQTTKKKFYIAILTCFLTLSFWKVQMSEHSISSTCQASTKTSFKIFNLTQ